MKKLMLLVFLIGAIFALAACGGGGEATEPANEADVASVDVEKKYQQKCSMCHGINLDDGMKNVPTLHDVGARLSKEEIEEIIIEGVGTMPGNQLQGVEATAVAEWLAAKK